MAGILEKSTRLEQEGRIRLIIVDGSEFGAQVQRFHYSPQAHTPAEIQAAIAAGDETMLYPKSIWWNGEEYDYHPAIIEGLEMTAEQSAQPTLTVSNLDGSVSALCINFEDMAQAVVTIIDTYVDYIDAKNWPAGQRPAYSESPDPAQRFIETWYIDAKTSETDETVVFNLGSPGDLQGQVIPTRQITQLCTWAVRGEYRANKGCSYSGTAYFDENGKPVTDPSKDVCGGFLDDCRKRFGAGLADPRQAVLDFGGFVAANLSGR